jgi:hypothetical protein
LEHDFILSPWWKLGESESVISTMQTTCRQVSRVLWNIYMSKEVFVGCLIQDKYKVNYFKLEY